MSADSSHAQAANALLTEHLHYTPLSLIDDIINAINNLIYQGISSLENGLLSHPPSKLGFKPSEPAQSQSASTGEDRATATTGDDEGDRFQEARLEIENGLHQLETLLESTVDKNFDKFEIYVLRNILTVPEELVPWIRLGHYENLQMPPPNGVPTIEALQLLRRKLQESQKLQRALLAESARNEATLAQLRSMLSSPSRESRKLDLSFLQPQTGSASTSSYHPHTHNLTTTTQFTLSQLPALRATLAALRPRLATLPHAVAKMGMIDTEVERREYIDGEAMKGIERTVGAGMVTDGRGAGLVQGPRRDKAEVEALERIAGTWSGR